MLIYFRGIFRSCLILTRGEVVTYLRFFIYELLTESIDRKYFERTRQRHFFVCCTTSINDLVSFLEVDLYTLCDDSISISTHISM